MSETIDTELKTELQKSQEKSLYDQAIVTDFYLEDATRDCVADSVPIHRQQKNLYLSLELPDGSTTEKKVPIPKRGTEWKDSLLSQLVAYSDDEDTIAVGSTVPIEYDDGVVTIVQKPSGTENQNISEPALHVLTDTGNFALAITSVVIISIVKVAFSISTLAALFMMSSVTLYFGYTKKVYKKEGFDGDGFVCDILSRDE